ncbi:UDP-N-acetylglucosamine 2-epimerase [Acidovorax sp. ACV02]|uniref:UDP-N-acetylglucosamine 2-epimerase n=1 Tax=Acidovorax sp. ACV02 TaxID=2769310 RepID=UPI001CE20AE7|nr:UDP-N-acetylglucosamine 2-epimerase [Acidovorax sp. ACV02]
MLPVVRALRAIRPNVHVDLIALTTAKSAAAAAGERSLAFCDLMHLADEPFAKEWGERLTVGNTHPAVDPAETAAYMGVNYWDLTRQHGADGARVLYAREGRYGFYPIHFFRRVVACLSPDVVVATNSPRSEHAALDAAMDAGIPTLSMIDLFAMAGDPYLRRARHADRVTVMLPQVRDNLVTAGMEASRIVVTGNPAFDSLFDPAQRQAAMELRRSLGWDGLKIFLWAGIIERLPSEGGAVAPGTAFGEAVEAVLRRWCARRPDVAAIVRYHPNEAHHFAAQPPQERVHLSRPLRDPLHPQILSARTVLVTGSTVGVEAASAGVPVLSLESSGSNSVMSYEKLGISRGVPSLEALEACLDEAADSTPSVKSAETQPGPASPRIAQEIIALAGR